MPNSFDTDFAADAFPDLQAAFGRPVTLCPLGVVAEGVSIPLAVCRLDQQPELHQTDFTGDRRMRVGNVIIDASYSVSPGLEHRPRDTILIPNAAGVSEVWGVRQCHRKNHVYQVLEVECPQQPVGTPPG